MPKKFKRNKDKKKDRREALLNGLHDKRNEQERRHETLNVLYQIKKLEYPTNTDAIKTLIDKMNDYVSLGIDIELSIPFPEINKTIKGKLPIYKSEEPVVYLSANTD